MPPHLQPGRIPVERKARSYVAEELQLDKRAGWGIEDDVFEKLALELKLRRPEQARDRQRDGGTRQQGRERG